MKSETFGEYIRRLREEKNLPLRKVAAQLDIDTSTLSLLIILQLKAVFGI